MKSFATLSAILVTIFLIDSCSSAAQDASDNEIKDGEQPWEETWEAPDHIKRNYPYYMAGFDYENRPIWVNEFGEDSKFIYSKWDLKKLVENGETDVFDKYADQFFYRIRKSLALKSTPEDPVTTWVYIFDMEDYSLSQLNSVRTISYILGLARKVEEVARNMEYGFLINMNFLAEQLIRTLRPVLGTTLDRAEISGTNRAKWLPGILKRIPKSQIPEWYGGLANQTYTPYALYG